MQIREIPGVQTPSLKINQLLLPDERYRVQGDYVYTLFAPKDPYRLSALIFLLNEEDVGNYRISTRGLNQILSIDLKAHTAVVQAGCLVGDLNARLFENGFESGIGPWPWQAKTITISDALERGGVLSGEKTGGIWPAERIIEATLITPDGAQIVLGSQCFASKAGMGHLTPWLASISADKAILAACRIRLTDAPELRCRFSWSFSSYLQAMETLCELQSLCSWERLDTITACGGKTFIFAQAAGLKDEMDYLHKLVPKNDGSKIWDQAVRYFFAKNFSLLSRIPAMHNLPVLQEKIFLWSCWAIGESFLIEAVDGAI